MLKTSLQKANRYYETLSQLGFRNVMRVMVYRLQKKIGYYRYFYPIVPYQNTPTLTLQAQRQCTQNLEHPVVHLANQLEDHYLRYFFSQQFQLPHTNRWFFEVYSQQALNLAAKTQHWSRLSSIPGYDIKAIWEASRFYWMPTLARAYLYTHQTKYLRQIEQWWADWMAQNPPQQGLHWLCAQEASIRCLNVFFTFQILKCPINEGSHAVWDFFWSHLQRIQATTHYAVGQQNNHASSEACCLYIISDWLQRFPQCKGPQKKRLIQWHKHARQLLESTAQKLVQQDGTFSQYSINYHRMFLDAMSFSYWWQKTNSLAEFSKHWHLRYQKALHWLESWVHPDNGHAPNLGNNDGSQLVSLHHCPFQDFRPSLVLAQSLLTGQHHYGEGPWLEPLNLLQLANQPATETLNFYQPQIFPQGGFVKFANPSNAAWALLRYPKYQFRPAQADCMHFDFWVGDKNLLRDSGTYSYHLNNEVGELQAHNTVSVDDHQPMPRLGRFLWGQWPSTELLPTPKYAALRDYWGGRYQHVHGAIHCREVLVFDERFEIIDTIEGIQNHATLHWHLATLPWKCQDNTIACNELEIQIELNQQPQTLTLDACFYAPGYLQLLPAEKLSIKAPGPKAIFKTILRMKGQS